MKSSVLEWTCSRCRRSGVAVAMASDDRARRVQIAHDAKVRMTWHKGRCENERITWHVRPAVKAS